MRRVVVLLVASVACYATDAASAQGPELLAFRHGNAFALYLDGGDLNGMFDTIEFFATPGLGESFLNLNPWGQSPGTRRSLTPDDQGTFPNALLFHHYGFAVLGLQVTPRRVELTTGPLGEIDTSTLWLYSPEGRGRCYLGNVMPSRSFEATVNLYEAGQLRATLTAAGVVPEPAAAAMAAAAALVLAGVARRRCADWRGALPSRSSD